VRPALVVTSRASDPQAARAKAGEGIAVITVPENALGAGGYQVGRACCPTCLRARRRRRAGAGEAWFVDHEGIVKEGAATNAWIVTKDGVLVTRPADFGILRGITRDDGDGYGAKAQGLTVEERGFSVEEAKQAREAFITAATTLVMPVVRIDDATVANGHPGGVALALRDAFFDTAEKTPV
jgi:D-alanine transaminase